MKKSSTSLEKGKTPSFSRVSFHQLEQLLIEAKSIREASTSNTMKDEERRGRAGDTALKLMKLLDHFWTGI